MDDKARHRNFLLGVLVAISQLFAMVGQALPIVHGEGTPARWVFALVAGCFMLLGIVLALKNRKPKEQ